MSCSRLLQRLQEIDGRNYGAYKSLRGRYTFQQFDLILEHIQGDPFAAPSRLCIEWREVYPEWTYSNPVRRVACEDYLGRRLGRAFARVGRVANGSGKSGLLELDYGGQQVLERSSVRLRDGLVCVRFCPGLPAQGRRVLGRQAERALSKEIPRILARCLPFAQQDPSRLGEHLDSIEDQEAARELLPQFGLVSFLADGSRLARRSGVDPSPLPDGLPLEAPASLAVELELPHKGLVRGLGVPEGITVIVGGGYHGKSTLLSAIATGIYNHLPGDGRELVVTSAEAVKVRAEDGRCVRSVDISPFLNNLPQGRSTVNFSSDDASGSTSQAAAIVEALELGANCLLIDEDTSATNFMIRDARMQELVAQEKEPITPLIDRIGSLRDDHGVSTVLVMGGSGDYLEVADHVLMLDNYRVVDVSRVAVDICQQHPTQRVVQAAPLCLAKRRRFPQPLDPSKGKKDFRIEVRGCHRLEFGNETIEVGSLEQLVDPAQLRAIGWLLVRFSQQARQLGIAEGVTEVVRALRDWDELTPYPVGNLAQVRHFEVAGALNRLRSLEIENSESNLNDCSRVSR